MNNILDVQVSDLFSDISYLKTLAVHKDTVDFQHLSTGETVVLSHEYVEKLLSSCDQFFRRFHAVLKTNYGLPSNLLMLVTLPIK